MSKQGCLNITFATDLLSLVRYHGLMSSGAQAESDCAADGNEIPQHSDGFESMADGGLGCMSGGSFEKLDGLPMRTYCATSFLGLTTPPSHSSLHVRRSRGIKGCITATNGELGDLVIYALCNKVLRFWAVWGTRNQLIS